MVEGSDGHALFCNISRRVTAHCICSETLSEAASERTDCSSKQMSQTRTFRPRVRVVNRRRGAHSRGIVQVRDRGRARRALAAVNKAAYAGDGMRSRARHKRRAQGACAEKLFNMKRARIGCGEGRERTGSGAENALGRGNKIANTGRQYASIQRDE